VTNIYRMMVDIDNPSLYYIGLNTFVVALYQLSFQAELAAAFISEKIPPISKEVSLLSVSKAFITFYTKKNIKILYNCYVISQ